MRLLEESAKNSNDDLDTLSLSSFLCRLGHDKDSDDIQGD
jgi:hypothetical protein